MKRQLICISLCLFFVISSTWVLIGSSQTSVPAGIIEIEIPVRGSFVRSMDDWPYFGPGPEFRVEEPAIIDLQSYGIFEGDTIYVGWRGGVYPDGAWHPEDPETTSYGLRENEDIPFGGLLGLFSTTSELLDIHTLNRVPGAINYGGNYITPETWWEGRSEVAKDLAERNIEWYTGPMVTDIPEDFYINPYSGMLIEIPKNAKYFFISLIDPYYRDNYESPNSLIVTIEKDTDEDGIPDSWEQNGLDVDKDGEIDLNLPMLGADWEHKDVFVEIDYMGGVAGCAGHRPDPSAIDDVKKAFANAPVKNPDGIWGINLHVQIDEEIDHQDVLSMWTGFDNLKKIGTADEQTDSNIIEAKKTIYHYCLYVHEFSYGGAVRDSSGKAEIPGNDFIIADSHIHNRAQESAAFMHELGHNLGLEHGGGDKVNYKPNYVSVMNYLFLFENDPVPNRSLDYSRRKLPTLHEGHLDELLGIQSPQGTMTAYSKPPNNTPIAAWGDTQIDWNGDGNFTMNVQANVNNFPQWDYSSPTNESLEGYFDWGNLVYRFRGTPNYADGAHPNETEELLTEETRQLMAEATLSIPDYTPSSSEFSELHVDVSALGTFLRADPIMEEGGYPVEDPTIVDLEAEGILGLEWILISYSGEIFHAVDWGDGERQVDDEIKLIGLFSETSEIKSIDNLNRVPGALDSGEDYETEETYFGDELTDVPEDFLIQSHTGTSVEIPETARFLFLCNPDIYYPDNAGAIQVVIQKLEDEQVGTSFPIEAIIATILVVVVIILLLILFRRRKKERITPPK